MQLQVIKADPADLDDKPYLSLEEYKTAVAAGKLAGTINTGTVTNKFNGEIASAAESK